VRAIWLIVRRDLRRQPTRAASIAGSVAIGVAVLTAADLISRSITFELNSSAEVQAITSFLGEQLGVGLRAMGLVASAVAAFIVFNALRMAVSQQRRQFGQLRAIGMTRRQISSIVAVQAAGLGLLGAGAGAPMGIGLSWLIIRAMELTSPILNDFGRAPVEPLRLAAAGAIGLTAALAGAVGPARAASREADRSEYVERVEAVGSRSYRRLALAAWLTAAVLLAVLLASPPADWIKEPWGNRLTIGVLALWLLLISIAVPGSIGAAARWLRWPAERLLGAPGRLGMDNSQRARGRVTYATLALMLGVAMIVAVSGFLDYWFEELFFRTVEASTIAQSGFGLSPVDIDAGMQAYGQATSMTLDSALINQVREDVGGRGVVAETYFTLEPKLSFLGGSYFSFVVDPQAIKASGGLYFAFDETTWATAAPIMADGCALLITPAVAYRNGATVGDAVGIGGPAGQLDCTVAAIGPTLVGASVISLPDASRLGLSAPVISFVFPSQGTDPSALRSELSDLAAATPGVWLMDIQQLETGQRSAAESVLAAMQGMLLLAIAAAGLGVLNTLMIGLQDRQSEMALLRASGATSRQIGAMLVTEGTTLGLYGGMAGLIAGLGATAIFTLTLGGNPLGIADFPVYQTAFNVLTSSLGSGLTGMVMAPVVTGAISFAFVSHWRARLPGSRMRVVGTG
jgi:putative ABC transport system permease protein